MPVAPAVEDYLSNLPEERRIAIEAVRKVIRNNIDKKFAEGIRYGMIGYFLPHSIYPAGYHCDPKQPLPYLSLANQKNYMSLYMFCSYVQEGSDGNGWFREAWAKTGKKLNMGKSCIRFKKIEDLALDVIAEALKKLPADKFIAQYEAALRR